MKAIGSLSARVIELLVAAAFVLVLGTLAVVWWRHERATHLDARTRHTLDSLTTVAARQRDSLAALAERYRVDTIRVRETQVRYVAARTRLDTALVTPHGDSVRVDTITVVRDLTRACSDALIARDSALTTCEARLSALRHLAVADSTRASLTLALTKHAATTRAHRAWRQGAVVGAIATIAAQLAFRSTH